MPRCIAFHRVRGSQQRWKRCSRRSLKNELFCLQHLNGLYGGFLGLLRAERPNEDNHENDQRANTGTDTEAA